MQNAKLNSIKFLIFYFLLMVFTAALFFSFSRSAWLALAIGLAVMIVLAVAGGNLKLQKPLAEIILAMGILLLVLFSKYQNLIVARLGGEGRLENKSNFERLASYQESWQLIKNNWLVGVGLGNYTLANYNGKIKLCLPACLRRRAQAGLSAQAGETAKLRNCEKISSYYYQPAHNVFLLVWAEIGIAGLIFFLGFLFVIARRIFFLSSSGERQRDLGIQKSEARNNLDSRLPAQAGLRGNDKGGSGNDSKPAILIALIVLMSLDHWLWSLHFGVLFFWLVLGITVSEKEKV